MSFAEDTALAPAGERRWRAGVHERWFVIRGPFGGSIAALLARALLEVTDHPPRTLAIHFVDAPAAGEVEITATVERRGRSTDAVSLRLEQDGRIMALALANASERRADAPSWNELPRPDAPPPETCARVEREGRLPPFIEQLEIRWVDGAEWGGADAWNRAWVAAPERDVVDAPFVAALADVWMPPAFAKVNGL